MRLLTLGLALTLVASAAGCSKHESSGLRGAGSMRVEVEVYKGPLGQDPAIQVGELGAVLAETVRALDNWYGAAKLGIGPNGCPVRKGGTIADDCRPLQDAIESAEEIIFGICQIFPSWVDKAGFLEPPDAGIQIDNACGRPHVKEVPGRPTETSSPNVILGDTRRGGNPSVEDIEKDRNEIARRIASVAASMKSKAFRVADANVHYVPRNRQIRDLLANFGLIVSEYSNQIQARVAVLHKQFGYPGRIAKTLPVSDYLRDAGQTDFIHLFDWYAATIGDDGAGAPGKLGPQERIRMAERLFSDYYWEKINEVYASGQGDVSMAFIKNDLGNWDLKSFSNNPRELLAAYRSAANAALKAVVDLAADAATGGGARIARAQQLLTLANQITTGEGTERATAAGLSAEGLHTRAAAKLAARRQQFADRAQELQRELVAAGAEVDALETKVQTVQTEVAAVEGRRADCNPPATCTPEQLVALDQELQDARKRLSDDQAAKADAEKKRDVLELRLKELPKDAAQAARDILDDHLAVIAALQEGVAGTALPAPTVPVPVVPTVPAAALPVGVASPLPGSLTTLTVPAQP